MKSRIRGMLFIVLGLLLTVQAANLFGQYEYQETIAGETTQIMLRHLHREMESQHMEPVSASVKEIATGEMAQEKVEQYSFIGILNAPTLGNEWPILNEWSYDLLQVSPCRYSGSIEDRNLILMGHNYKSHFQPLKNLEEGDTLTFTTVEGTVYSYQVIVTEILQKTELERLVTSGYDLTLFTCTNGGYNRLVVRCDLLQSNMTALT